MVRIYDDGLELRFLSLDEECAEPKSAIRVHCNPESMQLWMLEVCIELNPWIWSTQGWVRVEVAMALREAAPELATLIEILRLILPNRC